MAKHGLQTKKIKKHGRAEHSLQLTLDNPNFPVASLSLFRTFLTHEDPEVAVCLGPGSQAVLRCRELRVDNKSSFSVSPEL